MTASLQVTATSWLWKNFEYNSLLKIFRGHCGIRKIRKIEPLPWILVFCREYPQI